MVGGMTKNFQPDREAAVNERKLDPGLDSSIDKGEEDHNFTMGWKTKISELTESPAPSIFDDGRRLPDTGKIEQQITGKLGTDDMAIFVPIVIKAEMDTKNSELRDGVSDKKSILGEFGVKAGSKTLTFQPNGISKENVKLEVKEGTKVLEFKLESGGSNEALGSVQAEEYDIRKVKKMRKKAKKDKGSEIKLLKEWFKRTEKSQKVIRS